MRLTKGQGEVDWGTRMYSYSLESPSAFDCVPYQIEDRE